MGYRYRQCRQNEDNHRGILISRPDKRYKNTMSFVLVFCTAGLMFFGERGGVRRGSAHMPFILLIFRNNDHVFAVSLKMFKTEC